MVQKGDWVVIEGLDMLPVKLNSEPYEKEFTTEGRPVKRVRVTVADVHNPDGPYTNVELLRVATTADFHKHISEISLSINSLNKQKEEALAILGQYFRDTSNSHIID